MSKKDCEFCNESSFFEFDEGEVQIHLHNGDITFSSGNGTKARREYYLPVNFCPDCGHDYNNDEKFKEEEKINE